LNFPLIKREENTGRMRVQEEQDWNPEAGSTVLQGFFYTQMIENGMIRFIEGHTEGNNI